MRHIPESYIYECIHILEVLRVIPILLKLWSSKPSGLLDLTLVKMRCGDERADNREGAMRQPTPGLPGSPTPAGWPSVWGQSSSPSATSVPGPSVLDVRQWLPDLPGDVEDCTVSKVRQAGFTPLSDAVCWVILQLGASGQVAVLETIRSAVASSFPNIEVPTTTQLYDTLADLTAENKVYQTAQGYFVATPDSVRLTEAATGGGRNLLLSQAEAAALVHGEIVTIREGHKTHQSIQTNLADVICGGT
ncbi:unnamed protein product [Nesidiocoris tenuis]|uniref:Winged helix Storkhead-box1 domain-containing protein n=1 Tax=Nesidiocoris tenuis TaxID=355587 RepID=A0A6H5H6H8_9HEMI|nr:unnamed protein product [Nesidiocoris tenuis]